MRTWDADCGNAFCGSCLELVRNVNWATPGSRLCGLSYIKDELSWGSFLNPNTDHRSSSALPNILKLSPTILMTGLRARVSRTKSKAPALPSDAQSTRRASKRRVVSDDEDSDSREDEDEDLGQLSREELYARLVKAKAARPQRAEDALLSPEEQEEIENDPFADENEFHDDEDRSRTRKHQLGQINEEDEEDEERDEEDREENARPSKRARSDPKFTASNPTSVPSNISRVRRKPAPSVTTTASAAAATSTSTGATATQVNTQQNRSDNSQGRTASDTADANAALYTPFKIIAGGKKAREADASPTTKSLIRHSNLKFRVSLAVNNAYPDDTETANEIKGSFSAACDEVHAERRRVRYEKESQYSEYIGHVCEQRRSQVRGEVKTKAQALVASFYKLEGSRVAIAERVKDLIHRKKFTFTIPEKRQGMYGHAIFEHIISRQWFANASSDGCGRYSKEFNPIPLPLIALVATAVQCALLDWETGTNQPHRNKFEYDIYAPVYHDHLDSLTKWRQNNLARCAARQQGLWTKVWQISGREPLTSDKPDDFDEEDYNRASGDEA
ncbi:hypothetical protein EIP86_006657 [Pleurotus ostreatoroseus]|nr:hypothetical protein EIP86_006657 [Pleurotus ostreatoroseus]